ncbi:MAG: hypothetical protein H0X37_09525 [Herpetosiphonaceae bacterium]|nr:hypothetical protein [Herpetosiphonaceae bacterium]
MKTTINAVELVRRIRDQHYEELKDKTQEERIAFYRAKSQALHEKVRVVRPAQPHDEQSTPR